VLRKRAKQRKMQNFCTAKKLAKFRKKRAKKKFAVRKKAQNVQIFEIAAKTAETSRTTLISRV
jgi:hypothetical protein